MDIQFEIESAERIIISNDEELKLVKDKYFSTEGILPQIYKLASLERGTKSDNILKQLVKIRTIVDSKIKDYLTKIT